MPFLGGNPVYPRSEGGEPLLVGQQAAGSRPRSLHCGSPVAWILILGTLAKMEPTGQHPPNTPPRFPDKDVIGRSPHPPSLTWSVRARAPVLREEEGEGS